VIKSYNYLIGGQTTDVPGERKIIVMKLNKVLITAFISTGILMAGLDSSLAGGHFSARSPGGSFSAGNPGGLRGGLGYPLAHTPANLAWERNSAWAKYTAQPVQMPNVATGKKSQ
jgi:hypothetical protein